MWRRRRGLLPFALLACAACNRAPLGGGGDGATPPDGGGAALCVITADSSGEPEELQVWLDAPDRPSRTEWSRGGVLLSRWTYAYDGLGRLVLQQQDHQGPSGAPFPDGVVDAERRIDQMADS